MLVPAPAGVEVWGAETSPAAPCLPWWLWGCGMGRVTPQHEHHPEILVGIKKNNSLLPAGLQSRQKQLISEDNTNYGFTNPPADARTSPSCPATSPKLFSGTHVPGFGLYHLTHHPPLLTFRSICRSSVPSPPAGLCL